MENFMRKWLTKERVELLLTDEDKEFVKKKYKSKNEKNSEHFKVGLGLPLVEEYCDCLLDRDLVDIHLCPIKVLMQSVALIKLKCQILTICMPMFGVPLWKETCGGFKLMEAATYVEEKQKLSSSNSVFYAMKFFPTVNFCYDFCTKEEYAMIAYVLKEFYELSESNPQWYLRPDQIRMIERGEDPFEGELSLNTVILTKRFEDSFKKMI